MTSLKINPAPESAPTPEVSAEERLELAREAFSHLTAPGYFYPAESGRLHYLVSDDAWDNMARALYPDWDDDEDDQDDDYTWDDLRAEEAARANAAGES